CSFLVSRVSVNNDGIFNRKPWIKEKHDRRCGFRQRATCCEEGSGDSKYGIKSAYAEKKRADELQKRLDEVSKQLEEEKRKVRELTTRPKRRQQKSVARSAKNTTDKS
ncbi:hypothetical protein PENTCL1PPCAC_24274, partial [Pristionchus entomophagus]